MAQPVLLARRPDWTVCLSKTHLPGYLYPGCAPSLPVLARPDRRGRPLQNESWLDVRGNSRGDRYGRRDSLRVKREIRGGPAQLGSGLQASPKALPPRTTLGFVAVLFDAQLLLDLLQRHVFCLWNHGLHPNELQHHHAREERKDIPGREVGNHSREERRE